jgi:hypothetical protein
MQFCQVESVDGVLTCRNCGVPFEGPFAITAAELAAIGGRLDRIHRPCGMLEQADTGTLDPAAGTTSQEPRQPPVDYTSCIHRGTELRKQACSSCRGTVNIKIYACAVHGECELSGRLPTVKFCGRCNERELSTSSNSEPEGIR